MAKAEINNDNKLIVIGGSSGSLEALMIILPCLKKCSIPIILVIHRGSDSDQGLRELVAAKTSLHVKEADEKDQMLPGWIYIAPPAYHLLTEEDGTLSLDASEKVNFCRPSIDVTFASAATAYRSGLVAVLLSGSNSDGVAGMVAVKTCNGKNVVQDPNECLIGYMPQQAVKAAVVDEILSAAAIGALLNSL